jgi:PST family polysaccharide transporter
LRAAERFKGLKLLVDLVVLSGGQLLSKVLGFAAFAYLARALGPRAYGSAEYVIGLATFFTMLVEFGLGPVAVRDISKDRERLPVLAANVPFARLGIVVFAVPALLLAARFSATRPDPMLALLFALTLLVSPWKLEWLFQACEMMTSAAAAQVVRMAVFAAGAILLVKSGADLVLVGWVELAAGSPNSGSCCCSGASGTVARSSIAPMSTKCSRRLRTKIARTDISPG